MKRIVLMVLRNLVSIPYIWIRLCYHANHVERYTDEEHYEMLTNIVKRANKGGRVTIQVTGQENIPKDRGFIFYPNHQGLYDVLAVIDVCPVPFSVMAKQEVKNIPFLKQVFACMKAHMLDRNDVRQGMKIIQAVTEEVRQGRNYLIFAEGSRSKDGNKVQEFKGGSFKAATKARCPIIPVALIDAFKPFDRSSAKPVTVQVHFLEPILYEEYKEMKTLEIAKLVRERIEQMILKNTTSCY
jgi:1-acyl-sn-glycerol-3-phosphate acyltransferases